MMSLWDALRMNMMISYQELVRTFLKSPSPLLHNIRLANNTTGTSLSCSREYLYISGLMPAPSITIVCCFSSPTNLASFFLSRSCSNINIQRLLLAIYLYAAIVNCRNNFKGMLSEENTLPSPTKLTMTGRLNFFASTPPIKHGLIVMQCKRSGFIFLIIFCTSW
ncbi:Uncharacterised protein [Klebsiella pneumoniae]|nr:Uncharacterised protein [Klebsiella pneumoniae]SXL79197.1 Uncharacterised protein [Klebsiella pneumoniae]